MQKILVIKVGQVETLTFSDGSQYESAIRKKSCAIGKNSFSWCGRKRCWFKKKHHGGVDKASFLCRQILLMN